LKVFLYFVVKLLVPLVSLLCLNAQLANAQTPSKIVADSMAERSKTCVVCHGKEGRATNDGFFPRIAGKPSDYLFNQLTNFRDGRRQQVHMNYLVSNLPDVYLKDMAQYFANLDLPYANPQVTDLNPSILQRGQALVFTGDPSKKIAACVSCHGQSMMGMRSASPSLLGLPRDYLVAQLGAWQTGSRRAHTPDCMAKVAKQLSPNDIAAVTHWLAAQPISPEISKAKLQEPSPAALQCGSFK
jgi:cytochrome c553